MTQVWCLFQKEISGNKIEDGLGKAGRYSWLNSFYFHLSLLESYHSSLITWESLNWFISHSLLLKLWSHFSSFFTVGCPYFLIPRRLNCHRWTCASLHILELFFPRWTVMFKPQIRGLLFLLKLFVTFDVHHVVLEAVLLWLPWCNSLPLLCAF